MMKAIREKGKRVLRLAPLAQDDRVVGGEDRKANAGPSTALRSAQDDSFVRNARCCPPAGYPKEEIFDLF